MSSSFSTSPPAAELLTLPTTILAAPAARRNVPRVDNGNGILPKARSVAACEHTCSCGEAAVFWRDRPPCQGQALSLAWRGWLIAEFLQDDWIEGGGGTISLFCACG
jgi:hypothetical protein